MAQLMEWVAQHRADELRREADVARLSRPGR